ncbi:histidine phosphatase family protein [Halalkalibacter sp. APA_J-10(15)]|uniref:histidine phosphatase family protein n=1 Tax=Halalkalibacter sp. APA_J-10(15) TaxID=2933805 RepID=UPI001FF1B917|nr:histidine phosphatase family protein [Halalkalibacter sp. APA_J-10(15)]MCK0473179.1 phosphoglycerate mutase family protein [Halalkalibacter sp. APA_J-10(15)]
MLTHLYFVRHAHSTYTPEELTRPLSSKGLADAKSISSILEKENIDIIMSSPYKRAVQTVEGIAQCIGKEIVIEDGFKERNLSAQPVEDFHVAITKVWEEPTFSWEGGESNIVAQKRGVKAMLKVLETYEGKNIVVGTHGNIMVLMMNYFDEQYGFHFWEGLDMPDIYKLTFDKKNLREVERIWHRA